MIKTGHKSKPAGGLTHSLGAKQISEALSGVRIYDDLSIAFEKEKGQRIGLFVPGWNSRYMKGESTDLLDYWNVIEGAYSEPLNKWTIKLKPVHTDSNQQVKNFLLETALPILRKWFDSNRTETWFSGNRHLQIGLNETYSSYCIWETHNDRTILKKTGLINVPNMP